MKLFAQKTSPIELKKKLAESNKCKTLGKKISVTTSMIHSIVLWDKFYLVDCQHQNDTFGDSRALPIHGPN